MRRKEIDALGFRDMELFNYAILAKQAWNLFFKAHNLCARVLKSVYHPYMEFVITKCSQRESWS